MKPPLYPISLVVFDGDDTLWRGLEGGYLSGSDYMDAGRQDYTFHKLDELTIQRNDGQRFRLYSEVPSLLPELIRRGVLISLASYNHPDPVRSALQAFEIDYFFQHLVVEWSSQKDRMLKRIFSEYLQDGYLVYPQTTLFIDDDHSGRYRQQMASIGVHFLQKDVDIHDLNEILDHPRYTLFPAQKSLI